MDAHLRVNPTCAIPLSELTWSFDASGGPGGQHANTSNTRAEVRLDVAASRALTSRQIERLVARLGPVVTAAAADTRSQTRNRELALERLRSKLSEGLAVQRDRRPTKPSRAAKRRRLDTKARRSQIKRERRTRFDPD